MSAILMTVRLIVETLPRFSYRFADEKQLHDGIARVLTDHGIEFQREVVATPQERYDFLCIPGIVIEAKIHGAFNPAARQCLRYAENPDVNAVVLATSRFWGAVPVLRKDPRLNGKPFRMVQLKGQSF